MASFLAVLVVASVGSSQQLLYPNTTPATHTSRSVVAKLGMKRLLLAQSTWSGKEVIAAPETWAQACS